MKNFAEPDRPQKTIWRKCFAFWITKAIDSISELEHITFPLRQWIGKRASMSRYTYSACLVHVDTVNLISPECPSNEKRKNYLVQNYLRTEKLLIVH